MIRTRPPTFRSSNNNSCLRTRSSSTASSAINPNFVNTSLHPPTPIDHPHPHRSTSSSPMRRIQAPPLRWAAIPRETITHALQATSPGLNVRGSTSSRRFGACTTTFGVGYRTTYQIGLPQSNRAIGTQSLIQSFECISSSTSFVFLSLFLLVVPTVGQLTRLCYCFVTVSCLLSPMSWT